ncbi:MAG: hypothetical protein ABI016_07790, partial [Chthoniobacterales bacterium]
MKGWLTGLGLIVAAMSVLALGEPELPGENEAVPADIEPPLLFQNRGAEDSTFDPGSAAAIEHDLARARQRAASAERLFRAGIIAKVEAEQRALRVVQLESMLAQARLEEARKAAAAGSASTLTETTEAARLAAERQHRAEL